MSGRLVLAACCCCAVVLAAGGTSGAAVSQTISAGVDQNRDLSMNFADGTPIGVPSTPPGTLIPPGSYTINVNDDSDISNFDLQGPGVNMATAVEAFIMVTWNVTFQPCSLYSYSNDTVATSTVWFQTSASATNLTPCAQTGGGGGTTAPPPPPTLTTAASTTPGKPVKPTVVKPSSLPFRGTLAAAVAAAGKLSLDSKGHAVDSLPAGRYTVKVVDKSPKAGFVLQALKKTPTTVSSVKFVGTRSATVALSAGQWFFSPAAGGKKTYFLVLK